MLMLPKDKSKMAMLIGERCIINFLVNKVVNSMPLDLGSLVSLVSNNWLDQYHPYVKIKHVLR